MWDNRLEYDGGFDLSGDVAGEGREVSFTAPVTAAERRQARLYVKNLKDTELFAEVKITVDTEALEQTKNNGDNWPMVGLTFYGDKTTVNGKTASCALSMGVTLSLDAENNFNSLYWADPLNGASFTDSRHYDTSNPFDPTRPEGFTLTAYRDGETFYLFCNDILYATVNVPYITADTAAYIGLTVVNLPVKVTDYTFSCGEQARADFGTRLSQTAVVKTGEGVTVSGIEDGKAYNYKQELTFSVQVEEEYTLTQILLNGENIPLAELTDGAYKFVYYGGPLELEVLSVGKSKRVSLGEHTGAAVTVTDNEDLQHEYNNGDTVSFTVEPESEYYEIVAVKVNGEEVTAANGIYTRVFPSDGFFIITVECKVVKADVTFALSYENGTEIDAGKVSLAGATITLTSQADANEKYTVTVGENNAISEISGMKLGTYDVTTTAMNGKLKVAEFVCESTETRLNGTLKLRLTNGIAGNGSYKAELGEAFEINGIIGNRPSGNMVMTGLNAEGEVWFGATVRLSGAGASLNYGSMIGLYFETEAGSSWIEIGHPDGLSGASAGNGGVKYYDNVNKKYSTVGHVMTEEETAQLKGEGIRVAVCRTSEGELEVYFVIDGQLKKAVTFTENVIGTGAVMSFGVRLNTIYTGSTESEKGWIHNVDYAATAEELLGDELGTVEIKLNGAAYESGNANNAAIITVNGSGYELGERYTFTVTAVEGYNVTSVTVNGESATETDGQYAFVFNGKTEIAVETAAKGKVTLGEHTGAAVTVTDNEDLQHEYNNGDTVSFTVEPESEYYEIVAVKVNGEEVTAANGIYTRVFPSDGFFIITVECKVVKADVTFALSYENGTEIDAGKVSLAGATITLTSQADANEKYTVTVGENNAISEISGMKLGTYDVTTTAMNGKLKVAEFVCESTETRLNGTLKLRLTNGIAGNGSYKAELGEAFEINGIIGNRPSGNMVMTGLNAEGEVWFGATVRLSGAGASLNYGSMIGLYFETEAGSSWIEIGHPDGLSGASAGNGGVKYYDNVNKKYSTVGHVMTEEETAQLKGEGIRVAVCRTSEGELEVYFVIDGQLKKAVTFTENVIGTGAVMSFGVRLNTIYTGSTESEKGWIHNVDYAATAEELLGKDSAAD